MYRITPISPGRDFIGSLSMDLRTCRKKSRRVGPLRGGGVDMIASRDEGVRASEAGARRRKHPRWVEGL
jgi:hypothetical protein